MTNEGLRMTVSEGLRMTGSEGLRMTASEGLRVTVEGFRMTGLSSVILSRAKNLYSYRAAAHNSQTDPLPADGIAWREEGTFGTMAI